MNLRDQATRIVVELRTYGTETYNDTQRAIDRIVKLVTDYQAIDPDTDEPGPRSQWRDPLTSDPLRPVSGVTGNPEQAS